MLFWRIGSSVHSEKSKAYFQKSKVYFFKSKLYFFKSKLYFFESLLLIFFCVIGLMETEKLVEGVSEGVVKGAFIQNPHK